MSETKRSLDADEEEALRRAGGYAAPPPEERAPSDETLDAEWVEFDRLRARVHVLDGQIAQLDRERLQITRRLERMLVHIPPRVNYE